MSEEYWFNKLKDQSCFYPEVNRLYLINTIKDHLENSEYELSESEDLLRKCYFEVVNKVSICNIDNQIFDIVDEIIKKEGN